jgi:diguanylate cyclase
MIFSFSGNQSEADKYNIEFHESFEKDVTGIEKSFEKTSVEEIRNLVFGKLNSIKSSLKKKKEIDRQLHDDALSYISRLQDDLIRNETDIKKIQDMAEMDSLTGIYNRGAFQQKLKQEYNKFKENKNPCSLIVFDIDTFKKINKLYTYDNGDRILQTIAKIIKDKIPEKYVFARYGGGEFVIILPGADVEKSKQMAENTRKLITDIDFYHSEQKVSVTISLGVIEFQEKLNSLQILQKAHEFMKSAKKKGGNQVSYQ